jgi:hypothetical protein
MMDLSLDAVDEVLSGTRPIGCAAPPKLLRQRRRELTATWNCVSYAMEVLALDLAVLTREAHSVDRLQAIVDDLPDLLAGSGDDGAWSLAVNLSDIMAVQPERLLDLHEEMVSSDLADPKVVGSLLVRMRARQTALTKRKHHLETEMLEAKRTLLEQYAAGTASADDWLT